MAVARARTLVNLKEKGHFEHQNETERVNKYTLGDELGSRLSTLQIEPAQPMSQPDYTIRILKPSDKDAILAFLRRFFFRDEPMNQAVQLLETEDSRCKELEDYSVSSLDEDVSVAAVNSNGDIVSIIINGISKREDADYTDKSEECPNPKFRRILKVLSHLDREAKIWDKLPEKCDKVVEVRIASTHSDWRGRGLMRVLCEETERIAKNVGAGALRMDATSAFSAAAAERLGYKKVYSIPYKMMNFAPQPDPPHLHASTYIKPLCTSCK